MIDFILNNYEKIDKFSALFGFFVGVFVTYAFFKFKSPDVFDKRQITCTAFKDDKVMSVKAEVLLKNAKPGFIICPFYKRKKCNINGRKCQILDKTV